MIELPPDLVEALTARNVVLFLGTIQPYKFLDWFDVRDAAIFYGRAEDSRRLADMILGNRLAVLYGESGNGKTSLVRAGVKPRLDRQGSLTVVVQTWSSTQPPVAYHRERDSSSLRSSDLS
jgi:hypothetical protein